MAWTASILRKERAGNVVRVVMAYTDGTSTLEEPLLLNGMEQPGYLDAQVRLRLAQLTALDTAQAQLAAGPYTPAAAPEDSPAAVAQRAWIAGYRRYQRMRNAIALGLKTAADTDYLALGTKLKIDWKPEYLDLID